MNINACLDFSFLFRFVSGTFVQKEASVKHNQREAVIQSQHSPFFIPDHIQSIDTNSTAQIEAEAVSDRIWTPQEIAQELLKSGASEHVSRRIGEGCRATEFPNGLRIVREPWEVVGETPDRDN